jgi:hypothetical protein
MMHPKDRCECEVDQGDPKAVAAHAEKCEKRPYSVDYCACEVNQSDLDDVKAHSRSCGRKAPSAARPVPHAKKASSEDVDRCHVCSISTGELAAINAAGLMPVKGAENTHACPAHSDCYYEPSNYWNEGVRVDEESRVVTMDSATGEIIDPGSRTVVRSSYEEKSSVDEPNG